MHLNIESSWQKYFSGEFAKPYFVELLSFINNEYSAQVCYPPKSLIFNAFNQFPLNDLKVVIIGQDPYHGPGQANGLCFSVNDGVKFPPSLANIFKELKSDLGIDVPFSGNLERWAKQGVLLLNATLSVQAGKAASHQKKGWETFTDAVIKKINDSQSGVVFLLWGNYAQKKGEIIDSNKHFVLKAKHPSPLSANFGGWFGNKHFSQTNTYLITNGKTPISW